MWERSFKGSLGTISPNKAKRLTNFSHRFEAFSFSEKAQRLTNFRKLLCTILKRTKETIDKSLLCKAYRNRISFISFNKRSNLLQNSMFRVLCSIHCTLWAHPPTMYSTCQFITTKIPTLWICNEHLMMTITLKDRCMWTTCYLIKLKAKEGNTSRERKMISKAK